MSEMKTCDRCWLADATVYDYDTGSACHNEPIICIDLLREQLSAVTAAHAKAMAMLRVTAVEMQTLRRIAEPFFRAQRINAVLTMVSTELLQRDEWTTRPLYVMLTDNGDGTHMLTFREVADMRFANTASAMLTEEER